MRIIAFSTVFLLAPMYAHAAAPGKNHLHHRIDTAKIHAAASKPAPFAGSTAVASSVLRGTVSNVGIGPNIGASNVSYGNVISDGAFKDTFGVNAVVQNTGVGSVVQQSVTVNVDKFSIAFK